MIDPRFRGPNASGNGGYSCGVLARRIGPSAEVNLRTPPPLDRPMRIDVDGSAYTLSDGDTVVAEGGPVELDVAVPEPPSMSQARDAVEGYTGFRMHPFPECFVCGPHRDHHDGLHIFPGPVDGRDLVATPWTPDPSLPSDDGRIASEVVWAALDCPTGFGVGFEKPAVLARLRGSVDGEVQVGNPLISIGWPISREGRKREGGSALFTLDGELVAYAAGLWIQLQE